MGDINKMIQWMKDREGKVTYSQTSRLGPHSYDCSSAVYFSLIAGGFIPAGSMGWTGSLHDTTLPPITTKIARSECRKGDIFISKYWANDGHTGIFIDNSTIIHCSYGRNGIYTTPAAGGYMGYEPIEYYRLKNTSGEESSKKKGGDVMLLFKSNSKVYWLVGNQYTYVQNPTDLEKIKGMMKQAGYDTWEHTNSTQVNYIKKIATEK